MACAVEVHCNGMCHASGDQRYVAYPCWANPWANPGQTLGRPLWFSGKPLQPSVLACNKYRTEWQEACGGIRPSNPIIIIQAPSYASVLTPAAAMNFAPVISLYTFTTFVFRILRTDRYEPIARTHARKHAPNNHTLRRRPEHTHTDSRTPRTRKH